MMISYFSIAGKLPNVISIAGKSPNWYRGRENKKLAPKYWFFKKYKEDGDKDFYTEMYKREVLSVLNPIEVYRELGNNAILLCWEKDGEFCHRYLVKEWFEKELSIPIGIYYPIRK